MFMNYDVVSHGMAALILVAQLIGVDVQPRLVLECASACELAENCASMYRELIRPKVPEHVRRLLVDIHDNTQNVPATANQESPHHKRRKSAIMTKDPEILSLMLSAKTTTHRSHQTDQCTLMCAGKTGEKRMTSPPCDEPEGPVSLWH